MFARTLLSNWLHNPIRLFDIRLVHAATQGLAATPYRLPAPALIIIKEGSGRLSLDKQQIVAQRSTVLHGGKGSQLLIEPTDTSLAYYLVLYKAMQPLPVHQTICSQSYTSQPAAAMQALIQKAHHAWTLANDSGKLQALGLLYQLAGLMLIRDEEQLPESEAQVPHLLAKAMTYIQRRYADELSVEHLANLLDCSTSYLTRLFRRKLSMSTLAYITHIRLEHARRLLLDTDWSLRRIAAEVGYRDEYYFSRVFKKQSGLSPMQFREQSVQPVQIYPFSRPDLSIVPKADTRYAVNDNDYQTYKGDYTMLKLTRPHIWTAILFAAFMLVTACSSNENANSSPAETTSPAQSTNETDRNAQDTSSEQAVALKEVQHALGVTEIPEKPLRIAVYGLWDIALALDIPIAVTSVPTGHYLFEQLEQEGAVIIETNNDEMNFEAFLAEAPDLILSDELAVYDEDIYANLQKIAPTLVYEHGNWQQTILELGEALDLKDRAEQVIADYDQSLEQAREALAAAGAEGQSVAAIRPSNKDVQIFFPWFGYPKLLYNDLNLTVSPKIAELMADKEEGTWGEVASLELFPELTADHLFIFAGSSFVTDEEYQEALRALEEVQQMEVWKRHPAVSNNQAYIVSARHWMTNGPIADNMKINDVVSFITGEQP